MTQGSILPWVSVPSALHQTRPSRQSGDPARGPMLIPVSGRTVHGLADWAAQSESPACRIWARAGASAAPQPATSRRCSCACWASRSPRWGTPPTGRASSRRTAARAATSCGVYAAGSFDHTATVVRARCSTARSGTVQGCIRWLLVVSPSSVNSHSCSARLSLLARLRVPAGVAASSLSMRAKYPLFDLSDPADRRVGTHGNSL
jgi:hypothetical protein